MRVGRIKKEKKVEERVGEGLKSGGSLFYTFPNAKRKAHIIFVTCEGIDDNNSGKQQMVRMNEQVSHERVRDRERDSEAQIGNKIKRGKNNNNVETTSIGLLLFS